ncbi:MAG: hypothetical protein PUE97_01750 [Subdoligranulum variabile]|nr:hypothetical protein [Subdoligranulum variabile]
MENEEYETIDLLEVLNAVRQHLAVLILCTLAAALAAAVGMVLCLGVIFLQVMLDNKINSEEDVAKYLELTVVGVIPEYEGGKKKRTLNRLKNVLPTADCSWSARMHRSSLSKRISPCVPTWSFFPRPATAKRF